MSLPFRLSALACAAILCGCASAPPAPPPAPPTLAALLAQADAAVVARQDSRATGLLKQAAYSYPGDKSPWLRLAQLSFDGESYGDTISFAQAALVRDPNDIKALSLAAVSGLRVSSQALRDLAQKNNVSGTVRVEAQQLARLLRTSIGGDIIAPPKRPSVRPAVSRPPPPATAAEDPFRVLYEETARNASGAK